MTDARTTKDSSMQARLRWLWDEGLARRVVAEKDGRAAVNIPLTAFLVAAVLAPWLVALGGVAGILLGYQFRVDRDEPAGPPVDDDQALDEAGASGGSTDPVDPAPGV